MGYVLSTEGFDRTLATLGERSRIFAPVLKAGEGRFKDTDVIRYDYVRSLEEMELETRSDYSFKEILLPISDTLFFLDRKSVV